MWVFVVAIAITAYCIYAYLTNRSKQARDGEFVGGGGGSGSADANSNADEKKKPRISFYFGSQTGTAEGFASELAENGDEDAFEIRTIDMEDLVPDEDLAEDAVSVFIVATYVRAA